jgi:plastocyanin
VKTLALVLAGFFAVGGSSPARVQVVAHEFSFSLSRTTLKPGTAVIELANFGEDAHDLRLRRVGARHIAGTKVVEAGDRTDLTVKLLPGRYSFWCSLADHRARGMRATLIVRR